MDSIKGNLSDGAKCARRAYFLSACFLVLVVPSFWLDRLVARGVTLENLPGDVARMIVWSELFAHGVGVAVIGLVVFVMDRSGRRRLPRILASAYLAGLMANLGKLLVGRLRPSFFDLETPIRESFIGWLPSVFLRGQIDYGYAYQSFPSGHTATAVGLAWGLSYVYPQGRWLFCLFAMMAALQRIATGAHFLSDTVAAAALGCLAAALVSDPRCLGRWFDRIEGHRAESQCPPPSC